MEYCRFEHLLERERGAICQSITSGFVGQGIEKCRLTGAECRKVQRRDEEGRREADMEGDAADAAVINRWSDCSVLLLD